MSITEQFCRRADSGQNRAKAHYPAIAGAYALNQDETKCAAEKILTLGGSQRAETAAQLDIEEDILEKWESLFFDVRQGRDAVTWIHAQEAGSNRDLPMDLGLQGHQIVERPATSAHLAVSDRPLHGHKPGPI